jgi:hypothetical protein
VLLTEFTKITQKSDRQQAIILPERKTLLPKAEAF